MRLGIVRFGSKRHPGDLISSSKGSNGGARAFSSQAVPWLVAFALCLAVVIVFRGALSLFFAQEDFRGLAVAKGLLPRHSVPWRYASVQAFMDISYPLFGVHPEPYHLVSLALHALNSVVLFQLLARRLTPSAAVVGAGFFATHPALFTAIYWLSARSDLLATTFALVAFALAIRRGRERWLAVPAFAIALLSKESVILMPVAVWLIRRWARTPENLVHSQRDMLVPSMALIGVAYGLLLFSGRAGGIGIGTGPDAAYALDFGRPLLENLLTYVGWSVDVTMRPSALRFLDVRNPDTFLLSFGAIALWGLGVLVPGLRVRGWHVAGATFLILLLPVLPLRNHTYHYFLYTPLLALAWAIAAAFDFLIATARRGADPGTRRKGEKKGRRAPSGAAIPRVSARWLIAGACVAALTWNGARLVRRMEARPMRAYPQLRGDPIVDRSIIARNVITGLTRSRLPQGTDLVFLLRERLALRARIELGSGEAPAPAEEVYPEANLRTALFEGHGVRALIPQVKTVAFALAPPPTTTGTLYVVYAPTGEIEAHSRAGLDSLMRSAWINHW